MDPLRKCPQRIQGQKNPNVHTELSPFISVAWSPLATAAEDGLLRGRYDDREIPGITHSGSFRASSSSAPGNPASSSWAERCFWRSAEVRNRSEHSKHGHCNDSSAATRHTNDWLRFNGTFSTATLYRALKIYSLVSKVDIREMAENITFWRMQ